jgi:hypothetical protein
VLAFHVPFAHLATAATTTISSSSVNASGMTSRRCLGCMALTVCQAARSRVCAYSSRV